jgi:mannitol/fructose-specific phosphotransferase system IIA component (Ntr-type)
MTQKNENAMRVYELLQRQNIIIGVENASKKEIIEQFMQHLLQDNVDTSIRNGILKAILKRESMESTGIGNGIAIPHAKLEQIENFHIILGLSHGGIDFDAIDSKPVHIIFLVICPEKQKILYIRILARLARLLHNNNFRNGLLKQKTPDDVLNFIKQYESF